MMEPRSNEATSTDPEVTSPSSNEDSFSRPPEFDDPKHRKAWSKETISLLSVFALVLAIPGPLLVLLSYMGLYFPPLRGIGLEICLDGFYLGLIFNAFALVMGLCSIFRWKGFVAVCISIGWWCFVYWALAYGDWNL